jgi:hypothetical protein
MNDIAEERPEFFEGEYLGADDLAQIVVYLRDQSARHALGGHAWGIAAGLDLLEQDSPGGGTDVFLLPGYATDGYGRAIVVVNPLRLTVDLMNGLASGPVPIWLRYDQAGAKGVRPGFQVCGPCDSYSRTAESYALETGIRDAVVQRQSGISIGGEGVEDAREALRTFDDNGPIICDASVPFQNLPLADETKSQWLIPLGLVAWKAGLPGSFGKLTDDQRILSRRLRRYLGVVAEQVLAADGLIRLRRRQTVLQSGQATADACSADDLADPSHDADLQICNGNPEPNELVWVEGRMRITDDTRLLAARLEFRDGAGTDYVPTGGQPGSVPLFFERKDSGKNADLTLSLGAAKTGSNRFVINQVSNPKVDPAVPCGRVQFDSTARMVVRDDGKVGIGTDTPDELLTLQAATRAYLHVETSSGPHQIYVGADQDGAILATVATDDLRVRAGGATPDDDAFTRVTVKPAGQVGIGTTSPDPTRLVTLEADAGAYLIARTVQGPHQVLIGADGNGAIVSAMTNDDLVLRAGGNVSFVWIKPNGWVGVNTSSPDRHLTVEDSSSAHVSVRTTGSASRIEMGTDSGGPAVSVTTNEPLRLRTNGADRVFVDKGGMVGINTTNPSQQLTVTGSIALGKVAELFAPGATQDLRVIAGTVNGDATVQFGLGFIPAFVPIIPGFYVVTFDTPYSAAPVVLANTVGPNYVGTILNVTSALFELAVSGPTTQASFSFVVMGPRS